MSGLLIRINRMPVRLRPACAWCGKPAHGWLEKPTRARAQGGLTWASCC
jgi:hypothetical protein